TRLRVPAVGPAASPRAAPGGPSSGRPSTDHARPRRGTRDVLACGRQGWRGPFWRVAIIGRSPFSMLATRWAVASSRHLPGVYGGGAAPTLPLRGCLTRRRQQDISLGLGFDLRMASGANLVRFYGPR